VESDLKNTFVDSGRGVEQQMAPKMLIH
jgi:hypothetical protein